MAKDKKELFEGIADNLVIDMDGFNSEELFKNTEPKQEPKKEVKPQRKEFCEKYSFYIETELFKKFKAKVYANGDKANRVIEGFIREYIDK